MKVDGSNFTTHEKDGETKSLTLKQWLTSEVMTKQIAMALPANVTPERMTRIALTALSKNEMLSQSTPQSFMGALLTSAQLGLECNTPLGQAYLIPYKNNKAGVIETQFQLGYQGELDLCYRTKLYKTIQARIVYEGDEFEYSYGFNETLKHIPHEKSNKPVYVYAYYELISGGRAFEVMSWEEVIKFSQQYSQSVKYQKSSPWTSDPESMAKKTVLKKVMKYAPKTVEIAEAISSDSAVLRANVINDSGKSFIDVVTTPTESEQEESVEQPTEKKLIPQTKATNTADLAAQAIEEDKPAAVTKKESAAMPKQEEDAGIDEAFEAAGRYDKKIPDELF